MILDAEALAQNSAIVYETLGLPTMPVTTDAGDIVQNIQNLIDLRQELREDKKWAEADMVRDKLADSGIVLTDTSAGPVWRRKR